MKTKVILGTVWALLLVSMLTLWSGNQSVKAESRTWIVDDDGPADFTKIQDAIDAASSGDFIFVRGGTYFEYLTVYKSIALIGEDRDTTIVDGNRAIGRELVSVTADYVVIRNFTFQRTVCLGAVTLDGSTGSVVENNVLTDSLAGVVLLGGGYNLVTNNMITKCAQPGIETSIDSHGNVLRGNVIKETSIGCYILSGNNLVESNIVTHCKRTGIAVLGGVNNSISKNFVTNNRQGLSLKGPNNLAVLNTIANNGLGLEAAADGNSVHHNNFVLNDQQTADYYLPVSYPSGGNFWSDYEGTDLYGGIYQNETGSDGIGDLPYRISVFNVDRYPLMNPVGLRDHELAVSLSTPASLTLGESAEVVATVYNLGLSNEINVSCDLVIDGDVVQSTVIPELDSLSTYGTSYAWTPSAEGIYKIVACTVPILQEVSIYNNIESKFTSVHKAIMGVPEISLRPSESIIPVDSTLDVNVVVSNVTDLIAWQVDLDFSKVILNLVSITEGPFLKSGGLTVLYSYIWNDSSAIHVLLGNVLVGENPGVEGSGVLATFTFKAVNVGNATLHICSEDTCLLDTSVRTIPRKAHDGWIAVKERLDGDLNWDNKVDTGDIAIAARAFGSCPNHLRWNPVADINSDLRVDIKDIALIAKNFGKTNL